MIAVLPCVVVVEGVAHLRSDHALVAAGRIATAKVYSPYTYLLPPDDKTRLSYVYEVDGKEFRGEISNDVVRREPSFQFRTQEMKVAESGAAYVEAAKELASLVGVVSVTYAPSDPGYHQVGSVTHHESWSTEVRLLWGVVLALVGGILARYFFRVRPIRDSRHG